jgi:hypothetical protein
MTRGDPEKYTDRGKHWIKKESWPQASSTQRQKKNEMTREVSYDMRMLRQE